MRRLSVFASLALSTAVGAVCLPQFCFAADPVESTSMPATPIGRVTAAFGVARIESGTESRPGDIYSLIKNDDRIITDGGGVSILLASRVVLKVDAASIVAVRESAGETSIVLESGTAHVYVGQRPADFGKVVLIDPNGRIETDNGVFMASYNPQTRQGYYACEHNSLTIYPSSAETEKQCVLHADQQSLIKGGV